MMLACPLMRSARLFNGLREQRVLVPYLSSRKSFEDAQELITRFGDDAGFQAAALADRSRDVGIHIHFCLLRPIERLINWLCIDDVVGTIYLMGDRRLKGAGQPFRPIQQDTLGSEPTPRPRHIGSEPVRQPVTNSQLVRRP